MSEKVIVVKTGYNALTETDPNNLTFISDYNTLKYYVSGDATVNMDYSNYYNRVIDILGTWYQNRATQTVAHNLGYIPVFAVFSESLTDKFSMCPWQFADAGYWLNAQAYADDTNLYLVVESRGQSASGTATFDFSYKIFKNDTGL